MSDDEYLCEFTVSNHSRPAAGYAHYAYFCGVCGASFDDATRLLVDGEATLTCNCGNLLSRSWPLKLLSVKRLVTREFTNDESPLPAPESAGRGQDTGNLPASQPPGSETG